ncbi:MAG: alpha-L-fucosidase [Spirochaetales bacterium]|nr:alpha-L-fucosidase [Spirochaetales bacterium]
MNTQLDLKEYEAEIAATRNERINWWRDARFGMFIHYGIYSLLGTQDWAMCNENIPLDEYENFAEQFRPKVDAPEEWARLAKEAGMKYMVLTTKHHEGFCLWHSKVSEYNAGSMGPKIDIVQKFVDACRKYDLKVGLYYSLMDWHHPDGYRCLHDLESRGRFLEYTRGLLRELMSNYGKIDILWYDGAQPLKSWEDWESLKMNQMVRELQPDILINNRSRLKEDFGTPEERITASDRDWESCMAFNGLSWGYFDSKQILPFCHSAQQIIEMLYQVASEKGNLLLNMGPTADGSVPDEYIERLTTVGKWLARNGEAVYGDLDKIVRGRPNGVGRLTIKGNKAFFWCYIWPKNNELNLGGFLSNVKSVNILGYDTPIEFEEKHERIVLKNLADKSPDKIANIPVFVLEFDEPVRYKRGSLYPHFDMYDEMNWGCIRAD